MLTLAINTASSQSAIALLQDGKLLSEQSWHAHNDEAEKLMPEINQLLQNEGETFSNIKKVIVIKGPGSFTGLRVGITVANTIAYLNQCDLHAISTFDFWWKAFQNAPEGTALLVFAGRGGVYANGKMVDLPDLNTWLQENNITKTFGDIIDEQKNLLENVEFIDLDFSFGKVIEDILKTDLENLKMVKPLYIKKPSITLSKKTIF